MEVNFAGGTVTVFGNDELCEVDPTFFFGAFEVGLVVAVNEHNHVGILLDGTGVTQVGETWPVAFAVFDGT